MNFNDKREYINIGICDDQFWYLNEGNDLYTKMYIWIRDNSKKYIHEENDLHILLLSK